jgi:hypothetical protein
LDRLKTHDMCLHAKLIKLALVTLPRFARIVGYKKDALSLITRGIIRPVASNHSMCDLPRFRRVSRTWTAPSISRSPCHSTPSQSNIQVSYLLTRLSYSVGVEIWTAMTAEKDQTIGLPPAIACLPVGTRRHYDCLIRMNHSRSLFC